jgi:protein SCO1/2
MPLSNLMKSKQALLLLSLYTLLLSCAQTDQTLPYLGDTEEIDGQPKYYTIPDFHFQDQDSNEVSNQTLRGKAYVADFFFTSCPTICPTVKSQMVRLRANLGVGEELQYLSMSIDHRKDSIPVLKKYAEKLGIGRNWHLVQLTKQEFSSVANQYFNVAFEDDEAAGGYNHSGRLILVDGQGHIRAHCNGTDPDSVDEFGENIKMLLHEMG